MEQRSGGEQAVVFVLMYVGMKASEALVQAGQDAIKQVIKSAVNKYRERGMPGRVTLDDEDLTPWL